MHRGIPILKSSNQLFGKIVKGNDIRLLLVCGRGFFCVRKRIGNRFLVFDRFLLLLGNRGSLIVSTSGQGKDQRQGQAVYQRLFHTVSSYAVR